MKIANSFTCSQLEAKRKTSDRGAIHAENITTVFIILFFTVRSPRAWHYANIMTILSVSIKSDSGDTALSTGCAFDYFVRFHIFPNYRVITAAARFRIARRLRTRRGDRSSARTRSSIDNVARCLPTTDWTAKEAGACSTRRRSRRPPAHTARR